jgi:transcription initiation factor IIE alpha subunit
MTYDRPACNTYLAAFHPGFTLPYCEELLAGALEEVDRLQAKIAKLEKEAVHNDWR